MITIPISSNQVIFKEQYIYIVLVIGFYEYGGLKQSLTHHDQLS